MIDSYKQLKFYIQADRIINGYSEKKNLPEVLRNVINGGGGSFIPLPHEMFFIL